MPKLTEEQIKKLNPKSLTAIEKVVKEDRLNFIKQLNS